MTKIKKKLENTELKLDKEEEENNIINKIIFNLIFKNFSLANIKIENANIKINKNYKILFIILLIKENYLSTFYNKIENLTIVNDYTFSIEFENQDMPKLEIEINIDNIKIIQILDEDDISKNIEIKFFDLLEDNLDSEICKNLINEIIKSFDSYK